MTRRATLSLLPILGLMAACSSNPTLLPVTPNPSELRINRASLSVEILEVSLPAYAEADAVTVQQPDGLVTTLPGLIWADALPRAMTSSLVQNLTTITGARVAADPWPLAGQPDVEVSVWVDEMLVTLDQTLRTTGQAAIYDPDARSGGEILRFEITVPLADASPVSVARGHGIAWRLLAEQIAREL